MTEKPIVNIAEVLWLVLGRALLVGSIAGSVLAAFYALAQLPFGDLSFAAPIAAGVAVALLIELGVAMLAAESASARAVAGMAGLLLLAGIWLLARALGPFSVSLLALLGSASGAVITDFVVRQRGTFGSLHLLCVAAGAGLGAGLCLLLAPSPAPSHGLSALSAVPAGMLVCLAWRMLRR